MPAAATGVRADRVAVQTRGLRLKGGPGRETVRAVLVDVDDDQARAAGPHADVGLGRRSPPAGDGLPVGGGVAEAARCEAANRVFACVLAGCAALAGTVPVLRGRPEWKHRPALLSVPQCSLQHAVICHVVAPLPVPVRGCGDDVMSRWGCVPAAQPCAGTIIAQAPASRLPISKTRGA